MSKPHAIDRQALYDDVWTAVEPSIEGYGRTIQQLLETLTDEQLAEFASSFDCGGDDTESEE